MATSQNKRHLIPLRQCVTYRFIYSGHGSLSFRTGATPCFGHIRLCAGCTLPVLVRNMKACIRTCHKCQRVIFIGHLQIVKVLTAAHQLALQRRYQAAGQLLSKAAVLLPMDTEVHLCLARMLLEAGNHVDAVSFSFCSLSVDGVITSLDRYSGLMSNPTCMRSTTSCLSSRPSTVACT